MAGNRASDAVVISQSAILRTYSVTLPTTKAFSDVLALATHEGLRRMYDLPSRATRIALDGWGHITEIP